MTDYDIPPFIVMEMLEKAQQMESEGKEIIHLEVGEPDFDTPPPIKQAAVEALERGDVHYTHSLGKLELREAICAYYRRHYGVSLTPDRVLVTTGTSPAMLLAFSVLLNSRDEVILPDPHYACYPSFVRYAGGKPVFVPVDEADGFRYRLAAIKKHLTPRTKAIIVNSPANPTGCVMPEAELRAIASLGIPVVADEVYHGLSYGARDHTMLEYTEKAIVINGFSKRYAMTGWRLGFIIAPAALVRRLQILQQNLFISACSFAQSAAVAALTCCDAYLEEMVKTYNERRIYLYSRLQEMGIAPVEAPTGAFYMLANVRRYSRDSYALAFDLLERAGVALTPGIDFGSNGEGYLRISYANSLSAIAEGLDRIAAYLATAGL